MAKNRINIVIGANLKKFSTDMQNVKREMRKTSRKMKSLGQSMTRSLTVPLGLVGLASVKLAADFEQSMAKVKAVSGATGAEFKALEQNALELGRTTRYTAQQVAELQLNLSKLGFNPKEITQSTEAILNLALASGEDLAQSATVAANTMRGFGIATEESGRVADVMAKSFSSSGLDLEKFSVSMSKIAPIAKAAGFGFEQTVSMMSALADAGVEASTIGTSLRQIFIELSTKGISFSDAMEQIRNSTNKTVTATDLFDKRAAAAAIILAENETKLTDLSNSYLNAEGSAKEMAKTMDDTLMGAFLRLKSALEGAAIQIGDSLRPAINSLTNFVTKLADVFSSLSSEAKTFITVAGVILAAVGPLISIFGRLLGIISKSSTAIIGLGRSLALLGGPIGITIALFGSLAFAIHKYVKSKEKVSAVSKTVIQDIHTERTEMNSLFTALKHTKEGTDSRRKAIEELNAKYGEYLPNQITEKDNLDDIAKAQKLANDQLTASIVLKSKANDIEQANARYIEDTKDAMSKLSDETRKAKTRASGFTKKVTEQQAKSFEIGVLGIIEKLKDTSSQEAYAQSIRQIMVEVNALSKEQNIAIGNYRKFRNSILGLVNADVDRNNSLIEVNSEYKKLSNILGVVIGKTDKLNSKEGKVKPKVTTQSPIGDEKQSEQKLKDNEKYLAELNKQRIENIANEKRQALELAAWNSEQRIKEIQDSLADESIKNALINEETKRAEDERLSIIKEYNAKSKEEAFDQQLKSLELFHKHRNTLLVENLNKNQITEEAYHQELLQNDMEYLQYKLDLYEKFGKDLEDVLHAIALKEKEITDKANESANQAASNWESTFKSMESITEDFITNTLGGFLDALGQEMAGSTKAIDRFGENIIASFGKFISQFGQMLMAYGVAKTVLFQGGPMSGPAAIAAGAALVVLGGALKQMSNRASEAADGGYGNYGVGDTFAPTSAMGGSSTYGTNNDVMTLETVVYGRDIVLSSNRQHGTISRTRRK